MSHPQFKVYTPGNFDVVQLVYYFANMHKVLGSIPSTINRVWWHGSTISAPEVVQENKKFQVILAIQGIQGQSRLSQRSFFKEK